MILNRFNTVIIVEETVATRKLLTWLDLRRKSKTLNLAQKQIAMAIKTVTELKEAITAFGEGRREDVEERLETLFSDEIMIDGLRRLVFEELTKESLSFKYREDLLHIVKRLDVIADQVKDSARNVKILLNTKIPVEIWSVNIKIAEALAKESDLLGSTLEMLGIAPDEAKELARKVDEQENVVDSEYLKAKALFYKYGKELDFATMLVLKDLLESMEEIADLCSDTADYIKILAVAK